MTEQDLSPEELAKVFGKTSNWVKDILDKKNKMIEPTELVNLSPGDYFLSELDFKRGCAQIMEVIHHKGKVIQVRPLLPYDYSGIMEYSCTCRVYQLVFVGRIK